MIPRYYPLPSWHRNLNSQLESMRAQQLQARTNQGFFIKVHASLLAIICTHLD
jgi:hypothetical protein